MNYGTSLTAGVKPAVAAGAFDRPQCGWRLAGYRRAPCFAAFARLSTLGAFLKDAKPADLPIVHPLLNLGFGREESTPRSALPKCNGTGRCATRRAQTVPLRHRANRAQVKLELSSSADEPRLRSRGLFHWTDAPLRAHGCGADPPAAHPPKNYDTSKAAQL